MKNLFIYYEKTTVNIKFYIVIMQKHFTYRKFKSLQLITVCIILISL